MSKNYIKRSDISGDWEHRRCFLIGGGPSLEKFDFSKLAEELTVGINKSFRYLRSTVHYCHDWIFYRDFLQNPKSNLYDAWEEYEGLTIFPNTWDHYEDDVKIVKRNPSKSLSLDIEKGIYTASNSGFDALMIACALGCKEIYLLGYDFGVKNGKTHFHDGYKKQDITQYENRLKKFMVPFFEFRAALIKERIRVTNLNPKSALDCFEFDNFEKIIHE